MARFQKKGEHVSMQPDSFSTASDPETKGLDCTKVAAEAGSEICPHDKSVKQAVWTSPERASLSSKRSESNRVCSNKLCCKALQASPMHSPLPEHA
eukprot:CAMPEP_0179014982 /NCGR_PEP_ID=MMETSP0796-20121207/2548_1 /TAXON_ID=73915 /ORGANISM="Pyrodinium bahamense, Strain pbaha01" /LENGTH=95 /DNA_ID=CAMNT_0020710585 /DNA_START=32 /DNA_END=316 /DNA_ORIENTATION=+